MFAIIFFIGTSDGRIDFQLLSPPIKSPNKKRRRQNEDKWGDWKWNRLVFSPSKKFSGLWGLGGRVSGEVKTDERKTSPLISVKLLPRSSLCENNTIESIPQIIHWITATCGAGVKGPSFISTGSFQRMLSSVCENNTIESILQIIHIYATCGAWVKVHSVISTGSFRHILSRLCESNPLICHLWFPQRLLCLCV